MSTAPYAQPAPATVRARAFAAETTAEQRDLAGVLDSMHMAVTHASCEAGEAEDMWRLLVDYARTPNPNGLLAESVDVNQLERALASIRRLGGTWCGGCLYEASSDVVDDKVRRLDQGHIAEDSDEALLDDPARWVSLEEMAKRAGSCLP